MTVFPVPPARQRGLGWFGLLIVFGLIALFAIVGIKSFPLYMNQFTLAGAVNGVANDPELANADAGRVRTALQRRWDIDDIKLITPKDVKIKRVDGGRVLSYDYEARTHLFYNVFLVFQFKDEVRLRGTGGADDGVDG
ncbi:MAG TPA: DUF4845 domain-containing protein [Nevskiaceae bacterium]|nr:DUF4845 domain-containing protein [Nevskiaceae bacterium]